MEQLLSQVEDHYVGLAVSAVPDDGSCVAAQFHLSRLDETGAADQRRAPSEVPHRSGGPEAHRPDGKLAAALRGSGPIAGAVGGNGAETRREVYGTTAPASWPIETCSSASANRWISGSSSRPISRMPRRSVTKSLNNSAIRSRPSSTRSATQALKPEQVFRGPEGSFGTRNKIYESVGILKYQLL